MTRARKQSTPEEDRLSSHFYKEGTFFTDPTTCFKYIPCSQYVFCIESFKSRRSTACIPWSEAIVPDCIQIRPILASRWTHSILNMACSCALFRTNLGISSKSIRRRLPRMMKHGNFPVWNGRFSISSYRFCVELFYLYMPYLSLFH